MISVDPLVWPWLFILIGLVAGGVLVTWFVRDQTDAADFDALCEREDERRAMARVAARCRAHHPTSATTPEQ